MPVYEFLCADCNRIFSFFTKSLKEERIPKCPKCNGDNMTRQISVVCRYIKKGFISRFEPPVGEGGALGQTHNPAQEAKMEKAVRLLEREMTGMNEENPDPRQLGRLMRHLSEITGEPIPAGMSEAVRRLEAGEDPEKIEKDLGDFWDEDELGLNDSPGSPIKDPGLYDF